MKGIPIGPPPADPDAGPPIEVRTQPFLCMFGWCVYRWVRLDCDWIREECRRCGETRNQRRYREKTCSFCGRDTADVGIRPPHNEVMYR